MGVLPGLKGLCGGGAGKEFGNNQGRGVGASSMGVAESLVMAWRRPLKDAPGLLGF